MSYEQSQTTLACMEAGVCTGILSPPPVAAEPPEEQAYLPLDLCTGNWKAAKEHPQEVSALLYEGTEPAWVVETEMTLEQTKAHWSLTTILEKLNSVFADGRSPLPPSHTYGR